jgi:hypothetical protein
MSLAYSDVYKLQDGNTTSSGVVVSGTNDLLVDLSQRIKVDDIRLYTDDGSKSGNIYFYYKNFAEDEYVLLTTYSDADYYYANVPTPSAPQFIKATISGIDITLYEFEVLNDDYDVAYGEDGELYATYLANTPIGTQGTPEAIPIYNNGNSSMPVNAYTCVEFTGNDSDDYIEIASSYNGPYYKSTDMVVVRTNYDNGDTFKWSNGVLSNTSINSTNDNVYVTTNAPYTLDKGDVPLSFRDYSWGVGQNCWDYDPVNRVIYAIGAENTAALKLYKRYIDDDAWIYMGQINTGVTGFSYFATMCYINGYVYVVCNLTGTFGRYDVNGPQDNWESLTSVGWSVSPHYVGMCSDKNRYVYALHYYYTDNSHREFRRYDTTTSGWASMSNAYENNSFSGANYARRACLSYDADRDFIYADVGGHANGDYIQRYSVSGNSWTTSWFNVDTYTNASNDYNYSQTFSYYNNVLFFAHALTGTRLYYYNISTGVISYITMDNSFHNGGSEPSSPYPNPYILVTDIPTYLDEDTFTSNVAVWGSQFLDDRSAIYIIVKQDIKNGTYTSPIFELDNKDNSSYFIIKGTTASPTDNISYDAAIYNGTIKVRSSDIEPASLIEAYISYVYYIGSGNYALRLARWIIYGNTYTSLTPLDNNGGQFGTSYGIESSFGAAVDPKNGRIVVCSRQGNPASFGKLHFLNRDMTTISYSSNADMYRFNKFMEFDGLSYIWGYGDFDTSTCRTLYRIRVIDMGTVVSYSESYQDFIGSMSTDHSTGGCWYVNKIDNTLVHMNAEGFKTLIIILSHPVCVCKTTDNGCWVYDSYDVKVYRYDCLGTRIATFDLPYMASYGRYGIEEISSDAADGFWFRYGVLLYHADGFGRIDVGPVTLNAPEFIRGMRTGCLVHSTTLNYMYFINMSGQIQYSRSVPDGAPALFGQFYYGYDEFVRYKSNFIPTSYDPVWKSGGAATWDEVAKDGYFLPKKKYHQVDIKLWGNATLDGIYMAPAVKIEDIQSGQSKDVYVRTNIPSGDISATYETQIRTWWGVSE